MDHAAVRDAFLTLHALDDAGRIDGLRALADPAVRAEVAELLGFADDDPLIREPEPVSIDLVGRPPPDVIGRTLAGRYEVQALIAEGGFGWVFRGYDPPADTPVAIKLFKPIRDAALAAEVDAAIEREAAVLAALAADIPCIVAYRDVGDWTDAEGERHPFLVMQWLDGPTLRQHARDTAPDGMPLDDACALLAPVAEALGAAHRRGVAHRDIKPSNIICVGGARPTPMLIDFGAAKRAADRARGFDSTGGTPGMITYAYSAPEQLNRALGPTGPWSDVHALALLLVELMLGRHPYDGLDPLATMSAVTDPERRPTPRSLGLDVTDAVEAAFARALAVPVRRRPRDADALWTALDEARGDRRGWRRWLRR